MRLVKIQLIFLVLLFVAGSCVTAPDNFPSVPEISFRDMRFSTAGGSDSLIVAVNFKDAEGDLGLSQNETFPPFQAINFIRDDIGALVFYRNRPPDAPSFNPIDWAINPIVNNVVIEDTVWVAPNPDHFNIFVRFFIKRDGVFNEFRWEDPPFFTTFNGRFPRLSNSNSPQPVEGTIQYAMLSSGWPSIFRNDTLRIDVQIQDRALNRSNVASSPEVTLNQIRR